MDRFSDFARAVNHFVAGPAATVSAFPILFI